MYYYTHGSIYFSIIWSTQSFRIIEPNG